MNKPIIAVPIGDPGGIGPEIVAKALVDPIVEEGAACVIIGDRKIMENAIKITGASLEIKIIKDPKEGDYRKGILNLIDLDNIDMKKFQIGKPENRDIPQGCVGKCRYRSHQMGNPR